MALASAQDISARLKRELSESEEDLAELLLEMASEVIADAVGTDVATLETLDNRVLWVVAVEAASRGFDTPLGARSNQETLGQYSRSVSYTDVERGGGIFLTEREERMVRRAVYGSDVSGVRLGSILDDIWCS